MIAPTAIVAEPLIKSLKKIGPLKSAIAIYIALGKQNMDRKINTFVIISEFIANIMLIADRKKSDRRGRRITPPSCYGSVSQAHQV